MSSPTVGSLLAAIATLISDGLRILQFADKHHWGPDEHEQLRLLEDALDDAKKDFQELSVLVNGQRYYMNDRKPPSLAELQRLQTKFESHVENFKDWARIGGPINPVWARETAALRRELHRAQCRAASRIFTAEQESSSRCLGAFLVYRKQREWTARPMITEEEYHRRHVEEVVACNTVGKFERFGDTDIAFVCDYCDGHLVWEDMESIPSTRATQDVTVSPISPTTQLPHWQATACRKTNREEKTVVYAPLAIANHIAPYQGDWVARLECPFCEEAPYIEPGEDGDDETRNAQDASGFEDLAAFQEHLEWQHTTASIPAVPLPKAAKDCVVM
ncbi:hypothetical protein Cob_v000656 [Colletotrichum orbiculare MAFF 240422]|uniref:Uncharacterized protein n=1 Tax=Colletotrichum orbiculare (strain 104-T / ATCC 96160 / CBS 514.97 / LARS 414 / MAFF 240422) TaxID=1213857 RepID=N4VWC5_COLOR|nr:hypothetical protein Cob_v000656 [Colletotrichum orbiculare MAFF 240422]